MLNEEYKQKYIKYKQKYLSIKKNNMKGGSNSKVKAIFALYKANWCGHCKLLLPIWNKVQSKYKKGNIKFETYDSVNDADHIEKMKIQGFPTIHIKNASDPSKYEEYNGERTVEGFEEYINKLIAA